MTAATTLPLTPNSRDSISFMAQIVTYTTLVRV
jgi:hypothetical protein